MKKETLFLTSRQIILLIMGLSISGGTLILPGRCARILGAAGWLLVPAVGLLFLFGAWITARLGLLFPGETLIEFSRRLVGRPLGVLVSLVFISFFFLILPVEIRILQEVVNISLLPRAPSWFVTGAFLLVLSYTASVDFDTLTQVNKVLIEICIAVALLVALLGWRFFDPVNVRPVFSGDGRELTAYWEEAGMVLAFTGYPLVLLVYPFTRRPREVSRATVWALVAIVLMNTFFVLTVLGVFGHGETAGQAWPGLELAKAVNIEVVILERLDLILVISWLSAIFTTCFLAYFFVAFGLARLLGLRRRAYLPWALAPLVYYLSTALNNYFVWNRWLAYLSILAVLTGLVLPLFLLAVALLQRWLASPAHAEEEKE